MCVICVCAVNYRAPIWIVDTILSAVFNGRDIVYRVFAFSRRIRIYIYI